MKKLSLLLLCGFFACISFAQNAITISGKVSNPKTDSVFVSIFQNFIDYEKKFYSGKIDKQGNFKFVVPLEKPVMTMINWTSVFLEPGKDLKVNFDEKKLDEIFRTEGVIDEREIEKAIHFENEGGKLNNYITKYHFKLSSNKCYQACKGKTVTQKLSIIDSFETEKRKFIKEKSASLSQSLTLFNYLNDGLKYNSAYNKLLEVAAANHKQDTMKFSSSYFDFLQTIQIQNDSALIYPFYVSFLNEYFLYKFSNLCKETQKQSKTNTIEDKYHFAEIIFDSKIAQYMQARILINALNGSDWQVAEKLYFHHLQKQPENPYNPILKRTYEKIKKLASGSPAPDFTLKDLNGKEVSLRDFRGKVIYLDFWASWCKPCLAEVPAAKALQEKMKNKDVVFLYISIDEDEKAWRDMIAKKELKGIHLLSKSSNSITAKNYQISSIPNYFLIDRNGKIIHNRPPHPSQEKEIIEALEKALN